LNCRTSRQSESANQSDSSPNHISDRLELLGDNVARSLHSNLYTPIDSSDSKRRKGNFSDEVGIKSDNDIEDSALDNRGDYHYRVHHPAFLGTTVKFDEGVIVTSHNSDHESSFKDAKIVGACFEDWRCMYWWDNECIWKGQESVQSQLFPLIQSISFDKLHILDGSTGLPMADTLSQLCSDGRQSNIQSDVKVDLGSEINKFCLISSYAIFSSFLDSMILYKLFSDHFYSPLHQMSSHSRVFAPGFDQFSLLCRDIRMEEYDQRYAWKDVMESRHGTYDVENSANNKSYKQMKSIGPGGLDYTLAKEYFVSKFTNNEKFTHWVNKESLGREYSCGTSEAVAITDLSI
jgi:hypothetical protein